MQALETLLSSQLAAWHNRHPLARHVRAQDVHTMGVIALPFMRSGPPREAQEPVLGEPGGEAPAPSFTQPPRPGLLQRLLAWRPGRPAPRERWPVFSEQFVVGVSAAQAGEFARRHGYSQRPDDGSWPLRSIPVDETLAAQGPTDGGGAWPEEVYLLSAAIDAGPGRTRVLVAQGAGLRLHIRGPRCLHPLKVGAFGLVMALLLGVVLLASLGSKKENAPAGGRPAPSPAASAASAAARAPSVPASASAGPDGTGPAASAPVLPAGDGVAGASSPAPALSADSQAPLPLLSASQLPDNMASAPDIRPRLVSRPEGSSSAAGREAGRPAQDSLKGLTKESGKEAGKETEKPKRPTDEVIERANNAGASLRAPSVVRPAMKIDRPPLRPAEGAKEAAPDASAEGRDAPAAAETLKSRPSGKAREAGTRGSGPDSAPMVALVGPVMASKADAEAYLQKMQPLILPLVGRKQLEQQVLQTPEGWRAAVWPFASREEAQLINAMLVARGLRTRAVDF